MAELVTFKVHECASRGMTRYVGEFPTWESAKRARNETELDKAWIMRIDNHPLCPAECRVQKWGHTFERDRR